MFGINSLQDIPKAILGKSGGQSLRQLYEENPHMKEFVIQDLLSQIPFLNNDKEKERAYVGARGYGLGQSKGREDYPRVMQQIYDEGKKTPEQILSQASYTPSGQPMPQANLAQAYEAPIQEVMGVQEQVPQQPEVIDYTKKIPGSKMHTNDDEVWYWSPAPEVSGVPQKALDFYSDYNYNGNGQFETPLDPEYLQLVWNEINQQLPEESENNKIALLETMLSIAHAESHAGRDAGYLDRNSNVWNTGFNAKDTSVLKYDPIDPREAADRAVSSVINDFGVLNNRGLTDQTIHNYHIGPKAEYNQAGVDTYRDYIGGWESLYNPSYPWE